ncbi:hypothetical protein CR513_17067, partial [Mucuna pruriens]
MQAFRVICHCLCMEPTTAKFLHYYVVCLGLKTGWVSLTGLSKIYLFNAYSTSYKGFKGRFVKSAMSCSPSTAGQFPSTYDDCTSSMVGLRTTCKLGRG